MNEVPPFLWIIICILLFIIIFLIFREVNLWYFRINEHIKNQQEQIRLLRKIAGEPEPISQIQPDNVGFDNLSQAEKIKFILEKKNEAKK